MTQTRSPLFEDLSRLLADAASVAQGVRREGETAVKTQLERLLATMNVVTREEFEAVQEMAALAREENEKLKERIDLLEVKLAAATTKPAA
jgi:BMFP domain-containing protein YqiC